MGKTYTRRRDSIMRENVKKKRVRQSAVYSVWHRNETEICEYCLQQYSYEMQRRCTHCDGPLCPFCISINRDKSNLCPDCHGHCGSNIGWD